MTGALNLQPRSTAFVVVELQNDLVHPSLAGSGGLFGALAGAVERGGVLAHVRAVQDACRAAGIPVIHATRERHPSVPQPPLPLYRRAPAGAFLAPDTWGAAIVEEVAPEPDELVLRRYRSLDPSYGAGLWRVLRTHGADTLIVAGVSTTLAVEGTVRAAANRGFRTIVVADGCASVPDEWHRFSLEHVLPLLADVVWSEEVVRLVIGAAGNDTPREEPGP